MKRLLVSTLLVFVALGCDRGPVAPVAPVPGGGSAGSYSHPDRRTSTCVVKQRDTQQNLLFVIAWTTERDSVSASWSEQNLLTSIHGRPVRPRLGKKALYALQPNYTLSEVAMSEADLGALFNDMGKEGFHASHSELWQKQVAPKLSKVDASGGG